MPLYEYTCGKCGAGFEVLIRNSADQPKACPKCGSKKVEKQFSSFAAAVAPGGDLPSCAAGSCSTGSCGTGQCPLGGHD